MRSPRCVEMDGWRRTAGWAAALWVGFWSAASLAQEVSTATAADSGRASRRAEAAPPPTSGPGSMISEREYAPPSPPTAAEVEAEGRDAQLRRLVAEAEYFLRGAEEFAADQRLVIRTEYDRQRGQLSEQYERRIDALEVEERERRTDAIERFEVFIRKYPNAPLYTPDAMFRLAELYFEKASDDYLQENRAYEKELLAFERGERQSEPPTPEPRFDRTIGLHEELLARFPGYRLADAARYLLGYAYGEMDRGDKALDAYVGLTENHPGSSFLPEVWTRIGEIHFERSAPDSLERALAAYQRVLNYPDSPYYDKALYKIAWTYYRMNQFDDAVDAFVALVRYADSQKAATGVTGSELRSEAIQYIAISLADETWGGMARAKQKLGAIEGEPFTQELWVRYGDVLFEQTQYGRAVEALTYAVERYPNAPGNPKAQSQIVKAHEQLRDFEAATRAREVLVERFGVGSEWATANRDEPEALADAASLTETSLQSAAIFRHRQAQALRQQGATARSVEQYRAAASAYEAYLDRFPDSDRAYEFSFYLAETLFYSSEYLRAAETYAAVRDSTRDDKHLPPAALYCVVSLEKHLEQLEAEGKVPKREVTKAGERRGPVQPEPLPDPVGALVSASDRYLDLLPKSDQAPIIAYRAGSEYYKYDQFDQARARFESVIERYPSTEAAEYSANLIIESYLATEQWDKVRDSAERLTAATKNQGLGGSKSSDLLASLIDVRNKSEFKMAEQLNDEQRFEEAAETYIRLVDQDPKGEVADKALFNAAVAFEKVKRFDSASRAYQRIFDNYPKSALAPKALFRVGVNAEKGFSFDEAVAAYDALATRYPNSEDRADAMYNQAVVLEHMQRYADAAAAFRRYATTFKNRPDAGEVFFRSALVFAKMEAWEKVVATLNDFLRAYRTDRSQRERLVEAHMRIGDAETERNRSRAALDAYKACVGTFDSLRLPVTGRAGSFAARCSLAEAEAQFARYDDLKIEGRSREQIAALQRKAKAQREVEDAFKAVLKYKRLEQSLAAFYRIGHSYERFSEAMLAAPAPKELAGDQDAIDEYRNQLETKASVLDRKAEQAYRTAHEEARKNAVANQWTRRILEGLNKYAPTEFPLQKAGKSALRPGLWAGGGFDRAGLDDAPSEAKPESAPGGAPAAGPGAPRQAGATGG